MTLHAQILDIPERLRQAIERPTPYEAAAYTKGHRDARHAAAELALKADERLRQLADALTDIMDGTQEHDIQAITGLPAEDCRRIAEVRAWAVAYRRAGHKDAAA